jgi:hypothetical protein
MLRSGMKLTKHSETLIVPSLIWRPAAFYAFVSRRRILICRTAGCHAAPAVGAM